MIVGPELQSELHLGYATSTAQKPMFDPFFVLIDRMCVCCRPRDNHLRPKVADWFTGKFTERFNGIEASQSTLGVLG
jgi:hypothetical protein